MKHSVNQRPWINFKELRARLKFEDVLRLYNVEIKRRGEQHQGPCPLPGHVGNRTIPTFSANLTRGIFQCFCCKAGGNALEFAALMDKVDLQDGVALRKVAVRLQERFFPEGASTRTKPASSSPAPTTQKSLPVLINEPLDFELKDLASDHSWFTECGLTADTVHHFGLGHCTRGLLKDRIAIPLRDSGGKLIGYAGRLLDDSKVTAENPLHLYPVKREREGKVLDFQESLFLYNGHGINALCEDLIVVQGLESVWWLHQAGYKAVVALMGAECSVEQMNLLDSLVSPSGHLWFMPDGGSDGERLAQEMLRELSPKRFVRWVKLAEGEHPTDVPAASMEEYFR